MCPFVQGERSSRHVALRELKIARRDGVVKRSHSGSPITAAMYKNSAHWSRSRRCQSAPPAGDAPLGEAFATAPRPIAAAVGGFPQALETTRWLAPAGGASGTRPSDLALGSDIFLCNSALLLNDALGFRKSQITKRVYSRYCVIAKHGQRFSDDRARKQGARAWYVTRSSRNMV